MRNHILILVAALLGGAACTPREPPAMEEPPPAAPAPQEPQVACTMIGCEDGWSVEIVGELPDAYTVQISVAGDVVASVECSPVNPCGERVFLPGVSATEAVLEVLGTGRELRWVVTPSYAEVQPNGPQCPPVCQQARVRVEL